MNVDPAALNYVRQGVRTGRITGTVGGATAGGLLSGLPKTYTDRDGKTRKRTTSQRVAGGLLGAGYGALGGYQIGGLAGGLRNAHKWINKGFRPRPPIPDWLKGANTKAEARRAYHKKVRETYSGEFGADESKVRQLNVEWEQHEPFYKKAMLLALAEELQKIATVGAILGAAAGYKLSPNTSKSKLIGTALGAGAGHAVQGMGNFAKRKFVDEPHMREQAELYGYQPYAQAPMQGQNFY